MNKNLTEKIVELLVSTSSSKLDIAQLLTSNGVEISDEDMSTIIKNQKYEDIEDVSYTLSDDKASFLVEDTDDDMPLEIKKSFIRIPTKQEARFLEDIYYQMQDKRIAAEGQLRSMKQGADNSSESTENNNTNSIFLEWYVQKLRHMEDNIKKALEAFSDSYFISRWAKKNTGIGPVISTVLAANLEVKTPDLHAGNFWSYCGLNDNNRPWLGKEKSKKIIEKCIADNNGVLNDATVYAIAAQTKWKFDYLKSKAFKEKKGWNKEDLIKASSLIPYNKSLKVLMYKIGHSFRLCKNKPNSLYGRILKEREEYENKKNLNGDYAEQATNILSTKNIGKKTIAYKYYSIGQLPPAHIAQRAERYATKLFISHLFEAAYYNKYGKKCPEPYIIGFDPNGHNDYIEPEVSFIDIPRDIIAES